MRREHFDEIVDIAAQVGIARNSDTGSARLEQMTCVQRTQIAVARRIECHFCEYSNAKPECNIGLDHVRINRRQYDVRLEAFGLECVVDLRAAGKREIISDDREFGDGFERQCLLLRDWMSRRRDHTAVPAIAWQHYKVVKCCN